MTEEVALGEVTVANFHLYLDYFFKAIFDLKKNLNGWDGEFTPAP